MMNDLNDLILKCFVAKRLEWTCVVYFSISEVFHVSPSTANYSTSKNMLSLQYFTVLMEMNLWFLDPKLCLWVLSTFFEFLPTSQRAVSWTKLLCRFHMFYVLSLMNFQFFSVPERAIILLFQQGGRVV